MLATVVALEGSSYRRPGVRMLLRKDGKMIGAVSGGCVEKEVVRQAETVFASGIAKVMIYDGRYRLGCEGILYILLEPFLPDAVFLNAFDQVLHERTSYHIKSFYQKEYGEHKGYGSVFHFGDGHYNTQSVFEPIENSLQFEQQLHPCFKLVIIGTEHDAVQLCAFAEMTGWEVTIVAHPKEEKQLCDFPGATTLITSEADVLNMVFDNQTAVVLMTHSYVKDLQFMMALQQQRPAYFGLLGPARRREKLFNELIERFPDISEDFLEQIHGPAGIDIGAETPQEISISIMPKFYRSSIKNNQSYLKRKKEEYIINAQNRYRYCSFDPCGRSLVKNGAAQAITTMGRYHLVEPYHTTGKDNLQRCFCSTWGLF